MYFYIRTPDDLTRVFATVPLPVGVTFPVGQSGTVRSSIGVPYETGGHQADVLQWRGPGIGTVSA